MSNPNFLNMQPDARRVLSSLAGSNGGEAVTTSPVVSALDPERKWSLVGTVADLAGSQTISNSEGTFVGTDVPGLDNTFDIDIQVDNAVAPEALAVVIAAADDWNDIAAIIQVALRAATISTETVAVAAGKILVTSATADDDSKIRITAGTTGSAGGDLLAAISGVAGYTAVVDEAVDGFEEKGCTLADGVNNYDEKIIFFASDNKDLVITPDNLTGGTTITMDNANEYIKLLWLGGSWVPVENNSAVVA